MTRYTAFRCPEDLLEKAKAKARSDRRSLSNYIIMLIERDVSGSGGGENPAAAPASKEANPRERKQRTRPAGPG